MTKSQSRAFIVISFALLMISAFFMIERAIADEIDTITVQSQSLRSVHLAQNSGMPKSAQPQQECDEDQLEQDDVLDDANPLTVDRYPQRHNICPAQDVDWVYFDAIGGITYTAETLDLGEEADTVMCLYNDNHVEIACDDDNGSGSASRLIIQPTSDTRYWLRVRDYNPEVKGDNVSYGIQVLTSLCQADSFEPNNTIDRAKSISTNGSLQIHYICSRGDEDWISFNAHAGKYYNIRALAQVREGYTTIELYDATNGLLARSNNPWASSLIYNFDTSGTYYIKIIPYYSSYGTGAIYLLSVQNYNTIPTSTPSATPPSVDDESSPMITWLDAFWYPNNNDINVRVLAEDESGIDRVVVSYFEGSQSIKTLDLNFNRSNGAWEGFFTGDIQSKFFVQAVDKAGNIKTATNKGLYYSPREGLVISMSSTPLATPSSTPSATPSPMPTITPMPDLPEDDAWGIMIYLNGDNDLSRWTENLFDELELAVFHDPLLKIRVLWDRQEDGDTVLYHIQPDNSPYYLANYQEGTTKWSQGELNMGDPDTLLDFILTSRQALSTERYQLSIVDHGGGWSPKLLAAQPPDRRWAAGASGFSWDWTDGYSYLSTEDMGYIFSHPQLVQDPIDVVFYDACLMAMLEEAFEIREGVRYLVASQNETFTTFPYSHYFEDIESRSPREQAIWLVDNYYESLERDQYARTLSVLDLQQADELKNAVNIFATMIGTILALEDERITTEYIRQIFPEVQKLDYNFDLTIDDTEAYVDLGDFVSRIIADLSGTGTAEIIQAGQDVLDALKDGQNPFVIYERHASGYTGWSTKAEVDNVTGLSVYLPFGEEDPELPFYLNSQIDYIATGFWDEFIMLYLGPIPQSTASDQVGGRGNRPSPIAINDRSIYMPLIIK